ncbi:Squalene epoxidase [Mortierella alpina]|uniref:Squalene epoxidase ERG1 n=1 Tax=Mortierella alpina TaxID=64518 RepID=A0A9P6M166_MORAP|nr:Squalene epoxidase [Mortierella alpina]
MPGNTPTLPLATVPAPKAGSSYDMIVVGGGVIGSAFAATFGKQGKKILLIERDLTEPDRIVGELMQPGGYNALKELGLADCLEGIDAIPTHGYGVIRGSEHVHIPYTIDPETGKPSQGRSFHYGRFIQKLRAAASRTPNVTVVEATVNEVLYDQDGVRATGVSCTAKSATETETAPALTYKSPMVVIADGCFSKFRKQYLNKEVTVSSHFVGLILKDVVLPYPNHGHVILMTPSPVLMYQISKTETRILVDIPGKLPSVSTGALRSYLEKTIYPQLPATAQKPFLRALETDRLRSMPNSFLPPSTSSELGIIVLGDAMNMRHPLTGGGMTVALNDVVYLRNMLKGDVTKDQEVTMVQMELFFWKRKELSAVINILAQALYALFSGTDGNLLTLRDGCFSYFQMGGECIRGPVGLLSGLNRSRKTLAYHFFHVAFHSIWLMFHNADSYADFPILLLKAINTAPFNDMTSASTHLLEFKAGRCFRTTGTDTVKPDPTKGLVYLDEEDGLMHFYWKNRATGDVEDDLILFPGDAELISVPQCTTGRVVMLQFKSSSQKLFFWHQEASTDRDQIILQQVNSLIHSQGDEDEEEYLEDVAMDGVEGTASAVTSSTPASIAPSAAFAPAAPVVPGSESQTSVTGSSSLTSQQMDQLRHLLGGIQVPQAATAQRSNLRLDHVLTPGAVAPLLNNPQICAALFPHLPESSERTPEEIQAIVRTPQFSQALVSLSTALESGQLGPLLRQFGLGPNAGDGVEGFLSAIEEQAKKDGGK